METRAAKLIVNKSGGNAGAGGITFRATLPTMWIREIGLSEDDRNLKLIYDDKNKRIIIEKDQ